MLVVVADLATKVVAVARWDDAPVELGWATLRVGRNPGVGFALGQDLGTPVILGLTGLLSIFFVVLAVRGHLGDVFSAGLLVGGALGNVIDRFDDGAVVDWFDLGWWPAFNVADAAITVGIAWLLVQTLRGPQPADPGPPPAQAPTA